MSGLKMPNIVDRFWNEKVVIGFRERCPTTHIIGVMGISQEGKAIF